MRRTARVAALWRFTAAAQYLVTCAHVFGGGLDSVFLPDLGRRIGRLRLDLLREEIRLDVAVVELADDVAVDAGAVNRPLGPALTGVVCTWLRGTQVQTVVIDAIDATNPYLRAGAQFIRSPRGEVIRSDSGAPLMSTGSGELVGLITGRDTSHAYYTPLGGISHLDAIRRLP